MLGQRNNRAGQEILIDAEQLARIAYNNASMASERVGVTVYNEFMKLDTEDDSLTLRALAIGAVFEAGRVQGMREERARRAAK